MNPRIPWAQTPYLSKQILQGAGIKERGCIGNFFFLIAIFLLLRRMSPNWLLIIICPMPVGEIEPRGRKIMSIVGKETLKYVRKVSWFYPELSVPEAKLPWEARRRTLIREHFAVYKILSVSCFQVLSEKRRAITSSVTPRDKVTSLKSQR